MFCGKKLRITASEVAEFYREVRENLEVAKEHLTRLNAAISHYSGTSRAIIQELQGVLAEAASRLEPPELERQ